MKTVEQESEEMAELEAQVFTLMRDVVPDRKTQGLILAGLVARWVVSHPPAIREQLLGLHNRLVDALIAANKHQGPAQ
jgi:hypothetical protein